MSKIKNVIVDTLGSDRKPKEIIRGALHALDRPSDIPFRITLVGDAASIWAEVNGSRLGRKHAARIEVQHASQEVTMHDKPEESYTAKPDSSIRKGLATLASSDDAVFISPGNTGAICYAAVTDIGTFANAGLKLSLAATIPTAENGQAVLLDVGASYNCKAHHLLRFARMGDVYAKYALGISRPRIALLNLGTEEGKGNAIVQQAQELCQRQFGDRYVGFVEGNGIFRGYADVVVCDGFVGNAMLKFGEGIMSAAKRVLKRMPTWQKVFAVLGTIALLVPPALLSIFNPTLLLLSYVPAWVLALLLFLKPIRYVFQRFDYRQYGGAPLLGIQQPVIICHGRSSAKAITNGVLTAARTVASGVQLKIEEMLQRQDK